MGAVRTVNATEFKAKCLDLLDQVNSGATSPNSRSIWPDFAQRRSWRKAESGLPNSGGSAFHGPLEHAPKKMASSARRRSCGRRPRRPSMAGEEPVEEGELGIGEAAEGWGRMACVYRKYFCSSR